MKDEFHIIPNRDIKKHVTRRNCKCHPIIQRDDEFSVLVKHQSYDGREGLEMANKTMGIDNKGGGGWELIFVQRNANSPFKFDEKPY